MELNEGVCYVISLMYIKSFLLLNPLLRKETRSNIAEGKSL
jgi:hypothetical protein